MKRPRVILFVAALAAPVLACQLLLGIDDHDFTLPDAEAMAPIEASAGDSRPTDAGPTACQLGVIPPAQPNIVDDHVEPGDLVFVMKTASLRGRNAKGDIVGFDIDGVCTCDPRDKGPGEGGVSCTPPAAPLRDGLCDDDGGIDDAIAQIFDRFASVPGFTNDDAINKAILCGRQSLIYRITKYNGLANDSNVAVLAYQSNGIHKRHEDGGEENFALCQVDDNAIDNAGAAVPARFDGTDTWSPADGTQPELINGYVRDFQLVLDGRRTSLTGGGRFLPLLIADTVVTIGTPVMVVRLVPLGADGQPLPIDAGNIVSPTGRATSFRMEDGILSGRASAADVLSAAGTIRIGGVPDGGDSELCAQPLLYCGFKSVVCSALDTINIPTLDFQNAPCDSISMVLQFTAVPAQMGPYRPNDPPSDAGCASRWKDSCGDGGNALCP
jgi:hypothetical protein